MSRHRRPEPEPNRVPCPFRGCRGTMPPDAFCCGVCWFKLSWETQALLRDMLHPEWGERLKRFEAALAAGRQPEEIKL